MWFFLLWSRNERRVQTGHGYFNCPHCQRRRPCLLLHMESRWYLYGVIPMPGGRIGEPESYRCLDCHRDWVCDGVMGYDFGENAETSTWRCFKCDREVAYESFECPHCGYRLEVGNQR